LTPAAVTTAPANTAPPKRKETVPRWKTLLTETAQKLNGTFDLGWARASSRLTEAIPKQPAAGKQPKPVTKDSFFETLAELIPLFAVSERPTSDNVGGAINQGRYLVHTDRQNLKKLMDDFGRAMEKAKKGKLV
jgi:hypothetical protein